MTTTDGPSAEGQAGKRGRRWRSSHRDREAQRPIEAIDYREVRDHQIRTGDILLFSGAYRLSGVIEWATHCPYSDVAVHRPPSSMFCSQFVSCCFRNALAELDPNANDASTSPADIMRSGFFNKRGTPGRLMT